MSEWRTRICLLIFCCLVLKALIVNRLILIMRKMSSDFSSSSSAIDNSFKVRVRLRQRAKAKARCSQTESLILIDLATSEMRYFGLIVFKLVKIVNRSCAPVMVETNTEQIILSASNRPPISPRKSSKL